MAYTSESWNNFCDSMNRVRREQEQLRRRLSRSKRLNRCVQCQAKAPRWDSIYCSEGCKQAFLSELRGEVA